MRPRIIWLQARIARQPGERLPEALRPTDVDGALAIQRRVGELLNVAIGGWKCSVPSTERPVAIAPIYVASIFRTAPCPILPIAGKARIEPEIAFVIGRALPPRAQPYAQDEVRAAIGETRMAIELIGPRYANPATVTYPELLADNIANHGLFVGPVIDNALALPLESFPLVVSTAEAALLKRDGKHPDGHPLLRFGRARQLSRRKRAGADCRSDRHHRFVLRCHRCSDGNATAHRLRYVCDVHDELYYTGIAPGRCRTCARPRIAASIGDRM